MPFQLPIHYCSQQKKIFKNLYNDLELLEGETKGMYEYLFCPTTNLGKDILQEWSKHYTTNREFLNDSQKLYDSLEEKTLDIDKKGVEKMYEIWNKIKNEDNFLEKYQYVEWDKIKWLNEYSPFLGFMSFYNLASPLLNLLLPVIMLIIPFFMLKIMKVEITFTTYKDALFQQIKHHSIGRLFTEFNFVPWDKRIYILLSFGMYIYNIYQNIVSCYHFYMNMSCIDKYFATIKNYIRYTIEKMDIVIKKIQNLKTYQPFMLDVLAYKNELLKLNQQWNFSAVISTNGIVKVGKTMKQFYLLYNNKQVKDVFQYSFKFNGYWDTIVGLHNNPWINNVTFKKKSVKFTNTFYPPLMDKNPVKNDLSLSKNIIVTGPNAAGKTTLLKCTILNILFSQQVGKGFFEKGSLCPFDYIHCYLNIPDTSARDSLFQAEARRCKKILTFIESLPNEKHFCIFDELYSGTNHYEAIGSAYSYLKYISQNRNVKFMLTTHFIKLCLLFKKESNIRNIKMETNIEDNTPTYSYKIIKGISKIKGGICVLRQLNYPSKILKMTEKVIRSL